MDQPRTTAAIQQYLCELKNPSGESRVEPVIRELLARSVDRLRILCSALLYKSYPRLTCGPANLQVDELLSAVVERLLKSVGKARPENVREFFGLANQHMRWELNDLARRLDGRMPDAELLDWCAIAPESNGSGITQNARRMLETIEGLPDDEREVFSMVRIQGMMQSEVAEILGVSTKTIHRRLNRSLLLLTQRLADLRPLEQPTSEK